MAETSGSWSAFIDQARASVSERESAEQEKARAKYGEISLRPSGHPEYDVLDYAINEGVGLSGRYAEMVVARVCELVDARDPIMLPVMAVSWRLARLRDAIVMLEAIRLSLLDRGVDLGRPEYRQGVAS